MEDNKQVDNKQVDNKRRPIVALLFSMLFTPLGQVYNGQLKKGIILYVICAAVPFLMLIVKVPRTFTGLIIFVIVCLIIFLYVIADAVKNSIALKQYTLKSYNKWYIYLIYIIIQVAVIGPVAQYLIQDVIATARAFSVQSGSMEPTLRVGDKLIADMSIFRSVKPSRGDLVIYRPPWGDKKFYIHRCIAIEGDDFSIKDGSVYLNGKKLAEQYIKGETRNNNYGLAKTITGKVPPGSTVILGDNRENAMDSRYGGYVPVSAIKGKALYFYYTRDRERIGKKIE